MDDKRYLGTEATLNGTCNVGKIKPSTFRCCLCGEAEATTNPLILLGAICKKCDDAASETLAEIEKEHLFALVTPATLKKIENDFKQIFHKKRGIEVEIGGVEVRYGTVCVQLVPKTKNEDTYT